jgi:predicted Zn finger-like uncharacterized protein
MILTCPNCATRYVVDAARIGASGRQVRCARCAHEWHSPPGVETPPPAPAAAAPVAAPPPASPSPPAAVEPVREAGPLSSLGRPAPAVVNLPALRKPPRRAVGVGWLALIVAVLVVLLGLVFGRDRIMAALPQTKAAYAALGLAELAPPFTLDFDRTKGRASYAENGRLVIEGEIVNLGKTVQPVPPVRIVLRDGAGQEVASWTFEPSARELAAGARLSFSTGRESPPEGARGFEAAFVTPPAP